MLSVLALALSKLIVKYNERCLSKDHVILRGHRYGQLTSWDVQVQCHSKHKSHAQWKLPYFNELKIKARLCLKTYDGQLWRDDTQGWALASARICSCTEVHTQADTHTCEHMHTHKKKIFQNQKMTADIIYDRKARLCCNILTLLGEVASINNLAKSGFTWESQASGHSCGGWSCSL